MRAYLSGPMTGYPLFNYPAFEEATAAMRAAGIEVVSPHEINPADGGVHSWEWYMKRDIVSMLDADTIVLLPGSETSKGSRLELAIAEALGFAVLRWPFSLSAPKDGAKK